MQETQQNGKKYLTGADLVIRALIDENVDTIFGYPGGQVLAIYDALEAHRKQIWEYISELHTERRIRSVGCDGVVHVKSTGVLSDTHGGKLREQFTN